jgi:hypothetical protein
MKKEIYGVYAPDHDLTFIMEECITRDNEPISLEVKGFYYGEPNDYDNQTFYGDYKADFSTEIQDDVEKEYLVHLHVKVKGDHKLVERDITQLLASMGTKVFDGYELSCEYAHHEEL